MDFASFLQSIFLTMPTDIEGFTQNPYPVITLLFILFLVVTRRFKFLPYFVIALLTFLAGLFYGVVQPVGARVLSIGIFAFSTVFAIFLIIFKVLVKSH